MEELTRWEKERVEAADLLRQKFSEQTLIKEHIDVARRYKQTVGETLKVLGDIYMEFVSEDISTAKKIKETIKTLTKENTQNDLYLKTKTDKYNDISKEVKDMENGKLPG